LTSSTLTVASNLAGTPGTTVQLKASINAPEGIKTITVLKNGAAFDASYKKWRKNFRICKRLQIDNLSANSVVNFTVLVTDMKNQNSTLTTLPVTVTAVPPKTIVEVKGTLEGNITWDATKIYKLVGFVRVGEETTFGSITKTATLTIPAGTVVIGDRATKGALLFNVVLN
jgi:hypothetical protein